MSRILVLYRDTLRRVLRQTGGYECQESEGTFMLVFQRPLKAVQFCLLVSCRSFCRSFSSLFRLCSSACW